MAQSLRKRTVEKLLEPDVIRELAAGVPGFDRAGLLAALIEAWGGMDQVARDFYLEYQRAAAGSLVRQRFLDLFCRLLSQHSNDDRVQDVGEMDDDQLRAAIVAMVPTLERIGVKGPDAGRRNPA